MNKAIDDYPNPGHYLIHNQMCEEIDRLREENEELKRQLEVAEEARYETVRFEHE